MTRPKLTEEERKKRRAESHRRYRMKNREARSQKYREYHAKNREVLNQRSREYYVKEREVILERAREYHVKNREARNQMSREYHVRNREAILVLQRSYAQRNASSFRAKNVVKYITTRGLGLEIMAHVAKLDDFDRMMFASRLMYRAQFDPKLKAVILTQQMVDHFLSDYHPDEEAYLRDTLGPVHYDLPTTSKKGTANHEAAEATTTPSP